MSTVLNVAQLLLLLGLGFLYFMGLGWLFADFLLHRDTADKYKNVSLLQKTPLAITLGFIINYGISLLFRSLSISLTIGGVISIIGIWRFFSQYLKATGRNNESPNKWGGAIFICLLYLSPILYKPLVDWDARSIWFFHAKMIYTAGSFGLSAGWQHPSIQFSHTDYPNLVPGIAAQFAHILGYWNEYIPKISLVFILIPAIMWFFTFADKSFSFATLILLFPFGMSLWIWNGYMDGYLSLYLSVAMLLLGRYIQHSQSIDLISSMICLILLLYLKNEGLLAAIPGFLSCGIAVILMKNKDHPGIKHQKSSWRNLITTVLVLLPLLAWNMYKLNYGLSNDLQIGTSQSITRILERINNGSYSLVVNQTYTQIEGALLLLGLVCFSAIARNQRIPKTIIPALTTATFYYAGVLAIYIQTPHDLQWHLNSSAGRTMLPVTGCIFVACYWILDALEKQISTITTETI